MAVSKFRIIRRLAIVILCLSLFILTVLPSFSISFTDFNQDIPFTYRMYYDNQNRPFIAIFNYSSSNVNFGNLSPIGAGMLVNGDTQAWFRLPYGCMLAGIVIYNTYSQTQDFYSSADWWDFFNSYIQDSDVMSNCFDKAVLGTYPDITLNNLKDVENVICKSSYNGDNYLVFSDVFLDFLYHYCYHLLNDYGMFGNSWSFEQFYSEAFKIVSVIDYTYDISRNMQTYKDLLYSFNTSAMITANYIPINNVFEEYLIGGSFDPLQIIFGIIADGSAFNWMPDGFWSVAFSCISVAITVISILFLFKLKGMRL